MKMNTVIQLPYKEYLETWTNLIHTFYQEGMSNDILFENLEMTPEGEVHFSLELTTVLTLIAVMSFEAKPKLCTDTKQRDKLLERIVEEAYKKILPDADAETLNSCIGYFQARKNIFTQICKNIYSTNPKKRQTDLVGFARYLASQVSSKDEESKAVALEHLGILLSSASDAYMMLLENTTQDTVAINGRPNFAVKKESTKAKK